MKGDSASASLRDHTSNDGSPLVTGPIARTLIIFTLPTLASNVLQSLNGSINSIWVGRFLGEGALAATSSANIIVFLLFALMFGFGMSATVMVGQAMGRGDVPAARRVLGSVVGFGLAASCLIAFLGWIFTPQLLRLLSTPANVQPFAEQYMRVIFFSIPPSTLGLMLMMAQRGAGDSLTPLRFMILTVILDAGLNPPLILGWGPFPQMGIAGSAMATAIGGVVGLLGNVIYIYARDLPLRLRGRELRYLMPDWQELRVIIGKGIPMGLQMIVVSSGMLLVIGLVNREGALTAAAYGAAQQMWNYVQMPAMAVSAAASAMVAQNIGAGRWDRISRITWLALLINFIMTAVLIGLILVFDRSVLGLFLGAGSPAIEIGRRIQLLASWSFLIFGCTMVLFGTMRANGVVITPLVVLLISTFPVRLSIYFLLYPYIGADALWISFPVSSLATLAVASYVYWRGAWKTAHMVVPPG